MSLNRCRCVRAAFSSRQNASCWQPKDVVVFNEIFSKAASTIFRRLCNPEWRRNGLYAKDNVLTCSTAGHFGFATRVLNPAGWVKISGCLQAHSGLRCCATCVGDEVPISTYRLVCLSVNHLVSFS